MVKKGGFKQVIGLKIVVTKLKKEKPEVYLTFQIHIINHKPRTMSCNTNTLSSFKKIHRHLINENKDISGGNILTKYYI